MSFNKDIFSVEFPQYFTCFNAIEKGNFYIKISVAYIEKYIQSIFTDFLFSQFLNSPLILVFYVYRFF